MDLDDDRIRGVLVRASKLRSKIATCLHKASASGTTGDGGRSRNLSEGKEENSPYLVGENEGDEEAETLLTICDAFDALESQLARLQELRHRQQYEREAVISEIEYSRKMLLKKLSEYKGEQHSDVVQEAATFASLKVEHNNELLLSPYPSHAPHSPLLDNAHLQHIHNGKKLSQNGHNNRPFNNEVKRNNRHEQERGQRQNVLSRSWRGLRFLVGSAAKTMVTLVTVVSVLRLSGYEPKVTKKGTGIKVSRLFQRLDLDKLMVNRHCPPGKVAVREDGEVRCLVKERVVVPFGSVASKPNVDYGCG